MARTKCKCPPHEEGLAEWVMSYADMITILMAFFVVMYSMAPQATDKAKEDAVFDSLRKQFGPNLSGLTGMGPGSLIRKDWPFAGLMMPRNRKGAEPTEGEGTKPADGDSSGPTGDARKVKTTRAGDSLAIGGAVTFDDQASELTPEQKKQLEFIADEVKGKPQRIEVRGHTSRRSIAKGQPYRDNWDLAYARCRNTLEQLISMGVDPKRVRLSVAGDNEPPVSNGDSLARTRAGRVEVFLLNELEDRARSAATPKAAAPSETE